jgi:hypothetical protein
MGGAVPAALALLVYLPDRDILLLTVNAAIVKYVLPGRTSDRVGPSLVQLASHPTDQLRKAEGDLLCPSGDQAREGI